MRVKPLWLAALALSACYTAPYSSEDAERDSPVLTEERRVFLLSELENQREKWLLNRPKSYEYEILNNCFCPNFIRGPFENRVRDGDLVRVIYRGRAKDGLEPGQIMTTFKGETIDGMFETVERYAGLESGYDFGPEAVVNFTVEYDQVWGFPKMISYDVDQVFDEQYTLTVENFSVIQ